jgi:3'(2'), 5'-bisphosphate nucleotidase
MARPDLDTLADALLDAVLAAGRVEMRYYHGGVGVEQKADSSPVTEADREAEAILTAALQRSAPGVPIVAEEAVAGGHRPETGDLFFLVDPLDGTKEFIQKRDEFTVNIGLVERGTPVFGMVYVPALARLYTTRGTNAAFLTDIAPDAPHRTLATAGARPIACRRPPAEGLTAMASRSHGNDATEDFLARYRIAGRRNAGSSIKFCALAAGEADVYPRLAPTCEWDTAAGHAVLLAAGGSVVELDGRPLRYGKGDPRWLNPSFVAWAGPPLPPLGECTSE